MNWLPRILLTVLVAGAIVAVALWLARPKPPPSIATDTTIVATNSDRIGSLQRTRVRPRPSPFTTNRVHHAVVTSRALPSNVITNWEDKVDEILASNEEVEVQGRQLLALYRRFPPDGQVETAQHIANLLSDADYQSFGLQLADTNTIPEVQDVILADVLSRPNKIKLPLLLEVIKIPEHPKAAESRELLELFLEKDYGQDWNLWSEKIAEWLRDNPDE